MIGEPVRGRLPDPSFRSLPGIEQARAWMRGLTPRAPLARLFGLRLTQVGSGTATVTMRPSPWLQSADGAVEVRVLLSEALAVAVTTGAPPAHAVRMVTLSINQLRVSGVDCETFVARARTLNTGSTFTLAEVQVEDGLGRVVAQATGSFLVRPIDPPLQPWTAPAGPVDEPLYSTPDPPLRPLEAEFPFGIWQEEDALSVMRRIGAGDLPFFPVARLLGSALLPVVDEGMVAVRLTASEWFCSRSSDVAPGVITTVAFFAHGAALTLVPAGHALGVVEQSISLLRPVPADGRELLSQGTVIHHADDLVVSTAEVTDADGSRAALGHQTAVIRRRRVRPALVEAERLLATVMFTDLVGSTEAADQLGDTRWHDLLDQHHAVVRRQLEMFHGREVKTTGDGFLVTFDSPGRAVQCARATLDAVRRLGLELRIGLHTGECDVTGADIAGIAVHIAARVESLAQPGEILVSATVRDLVAGSGLRFSDRGRHTLKGIEGDWALFAVEA